MERTNSNRGVSIDSARNLISGLTARALGTGWITLLDDEVLRFRLSGRMVGQPEIIPLVPPGFVVFGFQDEERITLG
jgi:hypothetical protein